MPDRLKRATTQILFDALTVPLESIGRRRRPYSQPIRCPTSSKAVVSVYCITDHYKSAKSVR